MKHGSLWLYRLATALLVAAALLIGGTVLALRYWLLPDIDAYRDIVAAAISDAAHQRISIGRLEAEWDGYRPRLTIHDLRIYDKTGVARLALQSVEGTLSWTSLLGTVRFRKIELEALSLQLMRDERGVLFVAGMPLGGEGGDGGFGDWLLEQQGIAMRNSRVTWVDQRLGDRPLVLEDVALQMEKSFGAWRFGLRATPPQDVGSTLDLRGDLRRALLGTPRRWTGDVYLQLGRADLGALKQWVALPVDIGRGTGAVSVWLRVEGDEVRKITADVGLRDAAVRLRQTLPYLDLARLTGRVSWTRQVGFEEIGARRLAFATPDGLTLPAADVSYQRRGGNPESARSLLQVDTLDLAAVMRLIDRLPLEPAMRERLAEMNPRGALRGVTLRWTGDWETRREYAAQMSFANIALSPSGYLPGFSSVSGQVDATEKGGTVSLKTAASQLDLPKVFVGPLPLETLTARVNWTMRPEGPSVAIDSLAFSNGHVAGKLSGRYQAVAGAPGYVDLSATLDRIEGREVWRYVPLSVDHHVRDWLQHAIVKGDAKDGRVKLKGDLRRFPFEAPNSGVFEADCRFDRGIVAYGTGWPSIEDVQGQLSVRGARLTITASQGRLFGLHVLRATANIPTLETHEPLLELRGDADGPTQDFLRFVEESPVDRMIGGFTHGMRATGTGVLSLALDLPLNDMANGKVSGRYRVSGNTLDPGHGAPRLEQLSGELVFNEHEVGFRDGTAQVLGMPARFVANRAGQGALVIRGNGRGEAAVLRNLVGVPGLTAVSGTMDWQARLDIKDDGYDLAVESDLRGLTSTLPEPLAKDAAQKLPLRVQRHSVGPDRELLGVSLGSVLSAQLLRTRSEPNRVVRGEIRLNQAAPAPQRDGVWLAGRASKLDYDGWRAVRASAGGAPAAAAGSGAPGDAFEVSGIELQADELRAFGRDWREVLVMGSRGGQLWQIKIAAREALGTLQWNEAGSGAVVARFSKLQLPRTNDGPSVGPVTPVAAAELPGIDLVADEFQLGNRPLGRLALLAAPDGRDWRLQRLDLVSPDGKLVAQGVWKRTESATRMTVDVEASDVGAYFARWQLPPGIKGGSGRMHAELGWRGPPHALDLASLDGTLSLEAKKGRFVKVEPGIGKLIGVLSLQALPRRVALDFRDVFSEGFAFDKISANATIARGVAHTSDFLMAGTSARVEMKGDVSLAGETQRLEVRVIPSMSESVALGAAIVNPAVGIAALFAQKALKDPISEMIAFEYEITGTWDDPIVLKKRRDRGQSGDSTGRK